MLEPGTYDIKIVLLLLMVAILAVYISIHLIIKLFEYKERNNKTQRELIETIRRQQGLTFKYTKQEERYVHTFCEGQLLDKLGLTSAMVVGKDLRDFLTQKDAEKKLYAYIKAWKGDITKYDAHLNGVDYYVVLSPVYLNGKVVEVIGSVVDITDRKKAEKKLERNERFFKNVLSQMSEGVILYDATHTKTPLNNNIYKMLSVTSEEYPALTTLRNNLPFIQEDGSPLSIEDNPINITLNTGIELKGKVMGLKRNENTTWLSVNTKRLEQEGITTALITATDITIQKEQELKLRESNALRRTLIDSLPIGIIVFDTDMKTVAINRPFCEILALKEPIKDLIGTELKDYYPRVFQDLKQEEKKVMPILANKQPVVDEVTTKDNRILKRNYIPFYMDNELKGHLWTIADVTESKYMEKKIFIAKEEAEKANMAKSDFLSSMSHELRTPLNGILGFSQLLELDLKLNDKQKMFVQEILRGGRHLLSLINDILDLSRIETGKLKISKDHVNLHKVILECISLIELTAKQKGLKLDIELDPSTDKCVYIDKVRFKQVMLNLLDNAIKYNRENGEIKISTEYKEGQIVVHVIDSGIGICQKDQIRIFEPFYRVKNVSVDGAGIGLSLVKQLIQLMEGEVGVESSDGVGCDFWFTIPFASSKVSNDEHLVESENTPAIKEKKFKILYIEDNDLNYHLVSEILKKSEQSSLFSAKTGMEGIQLAQNHKFDLILLDFQLSDLNGFQVMEKLKANPVTKPIPVIAVSADAMPDHIEKALMAGVKEYITKPINIHDFITVIYKYLS